MIISRVLPASGCLTAIVLMLCQISGAAEDNQENSSDQRSLARRVIRPFNYEGVTLLPSMHRAQLEQVRNYYMRHLRPNDVLRGFRLKQKDWAPGKELGGAYSERPLSFGQWLGGFSRMYRATRDPVLRDWVLYVMDEWAKTIGDDGAYGYLDQERSHYDYDKMVGGLVDVYQYLGNDAALEYLEKITDWAEKNLDRSNEYALPTEWYTLSENLYRAYEVTGHSRYREFARIWEYTDFWNALASGDDVFLPLSAAQKHPSYHAYSHVNSLSSAALAYRVTGEKRYLDAIKGGYKFLDDTQLYATGGFGPEESLVVPDGLPESLLVARRGASNVDIRFNFETSCGSWAGFKLARRLMEFTGDARYGDWIERLFYNGVGALVPMNDYGMIMYGSSYNLYGAQKSHSTVWFCCQGSLPQTVAEYHNLIYFHDEDNVYVNLFVPSSVDWRGPDGEVLLVQETQFPERGTVNIRHNSTAKRRFGLKLRIPLWAGDDVGVSLNGKELEIATISGTWATVTRVWMPGDTLTINFDTSPRAEPLPGYVSPVAVLCGPVVMVQATAREGALPSTGPLRFPADYVEIHRTVRINPARNLHTNQEFRPFFDMRAGEFYRMYFNRSGKQVIDLDAIEFTGHWQSSGSRRHSENEGDRFSAKFRGSAVVWEGQRHQDAGIAEVKIDGERRGEVDQFAYTKVHVPRYDQREVPFRYSIADLPPGDHTIEVIVSGRKNRDSKHHSINVGRMVAYQ